MTRLRAWIVLLAVVSFTAGVAAGMMLGARDDPRARWGPLAEYEALLVERFDLSPERARALRVLLQSYERELARVQKQRASQLPSDLDPEIERMSREYDRLIREKVLPPDRRDELAELDTPVPHPR